MRTVLAPRALESPRRRVRRGRGTGVPETSCPPASSRSVSPISVPSCWIVEKSSLNSTSPVVLSVRGGESDQGLPARPPRLAAGAPARDPPDPSRTRPASGPNGRAGDYGLRARRQLTARREWLALLVSQHRGDRGARPAGAGRAGSDAAGAGLRRLGAIGGSGGTSARASHRWAAQENHGWGRPPVIP